MFKSLLKRLSAFRDPTDDFWYLPVAAQTASGVSVDQDTALRCSAVWSASMLLAGAVATLPLVLKRRIGSESTETAADHPLFRLLRFAPNPEMTSSAWRSYGLLQQVNSGNFYNEIQRDERSGQVVALWPVHSSRVRIGRLDAKAASELRSTGRRAMPGDVAYEIRNDDGTTNSVMATDMFVPRSIMTRDGIAGIGVITAARESIGAAIAVEEQGAAYFRNSARPAVVITGGFKFRDREQREEYRRQWMDVHGGARQNAMPAILPEGTNITTLGFSNEDSQFIETRQFNVTDVARWYRVPPHMIGDLSRATFSNIEEQGIEFVIYSLLPWLQMWEDEVWLKLFSPQEQQSLFAKHNVDGLLRGDMESRIKYYQALWQMGVLSPNEIREMEDLNPIDGGDQRYVPQNFGTAGDAEEEGEPPPAQMPADDNEDFGLNRIGDILKPNGHRK